MNKPLIFQQGVGPYEPVMRFGEDLARAYAERTGSDYEACAYTVGSRWSTEEKFLLPLKFMRGTGRVLMSLDADLMLVGFESWVDAMGDADFAGVRNIGGEINVGAFMIRDTDRMIAVLLRCLRRLPTTIRATGTPYCDQMILNSELRTQGVNCRELNRKWNDYGRAAGKLDGAIQIKGFHDLGNTSGPNPARKLALMKDWKNRHEQSAKAVQQQHAASAEVCAGPE